MCTLTPKPSALFIRVFELLTAPRSRAHSALGVKALVLIEKSHALTKRQTLGLCIVGASDRDGAQQGRMSTCVYSG